MSARELMNVRKERLTKARALMRKLRCTCLLVSDPVDVDYFSGFRASLAFLLITRFAQRLCTDFRYQEEIASFCRNNRAFSRSIIKADDYSFLSRFTGARPALAFQSDVVTVDLHGKIKKALPRARLVPVASAISNIASVKGAPEIRYMRKAAALGDRALAKWHRRLRAGSTEREAALALDRVCAALGSEKPAFDTIVLFGGRSALPHGRPGRTRLKKGDFVLVDFGCTVGGFCSDMTRTFVYGRAATRQREIYGIVAAAQAAARAAAAPGITGKELDRRGRSLIERAGFAKAFGHSLGHGVGRRIHEGPHISSRSADVLQEGMVVTIEPGIYLPGFGGVRIEDMVVVTKTGSRLLTRFPRELMEL